MESETQSADIVIIGAGLAGTSAATVLSRAGHRIALVDPHAVHQKEFRAEKLGSVHMAMFEKLGLDETAKAAVTPMDDNHVYRFGRLFEHRQSREYGFSYAGLVNGLRAALPKDVRTIIAKVVDIKTGPDRQRILLSNGMALEARLLIVATGLSDAVRRAVGVTRRDDAKGHSLSLGFNLAKNAADYPFQTLTYYGRRVEDRIAYLTLFPIGETMRANFFVYREASEPWVKAFRQNAQAMLCALMPEIAAQCAGFEIEGPVAVRPIDLMSSEGHRRDGVVLVGDAFVTTCPAPGVGIQRIMTDVDRLCNVHVPAWLATPGMGADKISAFYDDDVKNAMDQGGLRASYYSRSIATETGLVWRLRRLRNATARRLILLARQIQTALRRDQRSAL